MWMLESFSNAWIAISFITFFGWLIAFPIFYRGWKQIQFLQAAPLDEKLPNGKPWPLVSVIIAAKEEEQQIQATIEQLLQQDYPRMEIIAVNDRSSDRTGVKLDELKSWLHRHPSSRSIPLRVIHVTHLPDHWLGKNHALYQGYLQARGSMILFTDADVNFHRRTLRDAVYYMEAQGIDHLTLFPKMIANTYWLRCFVHYFMFCLTIILRPWLSNHDDRHQDGIGVGAFNLLKRTAYEKIGTHRAFPMYPDDDLELGRRVKRNNLKQRVLVGSERIEVEWYTHLKEAVQGLEKNFFSGFSYRLAYASFAIIGQLLFFLLPFIGLFVWSSPFTFWLHLISACLLLTLYGFSLRKMGIPLQFLEFVCLPLHCLLLTYVLIRSVFLTIKRGGIIWRGTFYSLRDLKRMRRD